MICHVIVKEKLTEQIILGNTVIATGLKLYYVIAYQKVDE